jgi:large subunit ribosomal protein L3
MSVTGILGKKIGMTQLFDDRGDIHPVTVLKVGPCVITQLKTIAKDGYDAAQIGLVEFVKASKVNKAMTGHFAKTNVPPVREIREVQLESVLGGEDDQTAKAGDRITVEIFNETKFVDVIGNSKGRGFAGVVRRHGFGGGPKSHGHMFQVQGSIGASSFPSRVFPGQRMPGHMGTNQVRFAICAFVASTSKTIFCWLRVRFRELGTDTSWFRRRRRHRESVADLPAAETRMR